ncbi:glycosyltransferase [Clostridium carnis]
MDNKLISIILLSYKNLEYIFQAIDSVIIQNYPNIELIIADDGTENFNKSIFLDYINKKNNGNIKNIIIYTNENNLGTTKNMNKAITLSKGKYIKFIDADDAFYENSTISKMVDYMYRENSLIILTNVLFCDENLNELDIANKKIKKFRRELPLGVNPEVFFKMSALNCRIGASGVLYDKDLFKRYGLFDESYKLLEDWPMWLRLSREGCKIDYYDIISVKYRYDVGVSSSKNPNKIYIEDMIKCYEKDVLPYKKELGYFVYKNAKWRFTKKYKFKEYSTIKKIIKLISNIDVIIINKIEILIEKLRY